MDLVIDGIGVVSRVLEAWKLDAGAIGGIYCRVLAESPGEHWAILSGARLKTVPNDSLRTRDNYSRAYANYQRARDLCVSGHLREHYALTPGGSESQCLSILLGTPSCRKHATSRYRLSRLTEAELQDVIDQLQAEHDADREIDNWTPEERAEYTRHVQADQSDGPGFVYLLASEDDQYRDLVKIGMTRRSIQQRIAELAEEPAGLFSRCRELFHIEVPNPQTIEKGLHYLFAASKRSITFPDAVAEEWFDMDWERAKRVMQIVTEEL